MDLSLVTVRGYRRFKSQTSLKTNGKLVALLGPNESGKTSLLNAIHLLGHDEPPASNDFARDQPEDDFLIEAKFFLSPEDIEAASLAAPSWLRVVKRADGRRRYGIEPPPPIRDLVPRRRLAECLVTAKKSPKFRSRVEIEEAFEGYEEALEILDREDEDLGSAEIDQVTSFGRSLIPHIEERDPVKLKRLPELLDAFREVESGPNPGQFARNVLKPRLPEILIFDQEARSLASEYDLSTLAADVPSALRNLCHVAGLDIDTLISAHNAGNDSKVTTLEVAANGTLQERFKSDWQQSGVNVHLRVQNNRLLIQVMNQRREFTSFAERSDGLRQFVALQAFATGKHSASPILLIDEAEQRLHYDAQADLVQMLARQQISDKVIYTTHSAGCLPEDLGNGVRLTCVLDEDETQSKVTNKFWVQNEMGFAPLLFGMGASTLAFFPTRRAVLVEGASDMLLLPTMFREALGLKSLGFQFVPGLSSSKSDAKIHAPTIGNASGVLYLVDSDGGGKDIKRHLLKHNVKEDNIIELCSKDGMAREVEDFVELNLLIEATNRLIRKFHGGVAELKKAELSGRERLSKLEKLFEARTGQDIPKVELAYEILDLLGANPELKIIDAQRLNCFRKAAASVLKQFELAAKKLSNRPDASLLWCGTR